MRAAVAWLALFPLAGCVASDEAPAPPALTDARIVTLAAPACAVRWTPVDLTLVVANPGPQAGRAHVGVYAQQYGYVAQADVDLAPRETKTVALRGSIDLPGRWTIFAQGPQADATQAQVRVVDAGEAC